MTKYKCIGGQFDGEQTTEDGSRVLMKKLEPRYVLLPPLSELFDDPPDVSVSNVVAQWYTARVVHCNDTKIYFYAPEEWSDERALRHVLT